MRTITIWINGDDAVKVVTNIGIESLINTVNEYKHSHRYYTEDTLENFLTVKHGDSITIIPRDFEEINTLLS